MKRIKYIATIATIVLILTMMVLMMGSAGSCQRQADKVSYNLSLEADNFNVYRQLTVVNQRTDTVIFQMRGNFSITKESDGDLAVTGEDENGQYYKHFIFLSSEISYVVEQLDSSNVSKHKYEINFNPDMIIPFEFDYID